jgi:hypothetical protein
MSTEVLILLWIALLALVIALLAVRNDPYGGGFSHRDCDEGGSRWRRKS